MSQTYHVIVYDKIVFLLWTINRYTIIYTVCSRSWQTIVAVRTRFCIIESKLPWLQIKDKNFGFYFLRCSKHWLFIVYKFELFISKKVLISNKYNSLFVLKNVWASVWVRETHFLDHMLLYERHMLLCYYLCV